MTESRRTTRFSFDVANSTADSSTTQPYTDAYSLHTPQGSKASSSRPVLVFSHPFNNARGYWNPQVHDPRLSSYTKIVLDAVGFGESSTGGRPWSFDLAAHSIHVILDELESEGEIVQGGKAVIVGDSMGGGPTGLRVALEDGRRVKTGKKDRIAGVVACGTSAEEESEDIANDMLNGAKTFKEQSFDPKIGVEKAIQNLASDMGQAGYSCPTLKPSTLSHGQRVVEESLKLAIVDDEGNLKPEHASRVVQQNFDTLCFRKGLLAKLTCRPSPLGKTQVLVIHGTEEQAYPFDRKYHERTVSAIGEDNSELYVVQGGPHFVTATHWEEVDRVIDEWIQRKLHLRK